MDCGWVSLAKDHRSPETFPMFLCFISYFHFFSFVETFWRIFIMCYNAIGFPVKLISKMKLYLNFTLKVFIQNWKEMKSIRLAIGEVELYLKMKWKDSKIIVIEVGTSRHFSADEWFNWRLVLTSFTPDMFADVLHIRWRGQNICINWSVCLSSCLLLCLCVSVSAAVVSCILYSLLPSTWNVFFNEP